MAGYRGKSGRTGALLIAVAAACGPGGTAAFAEDGVYDDAFARRIGNSGSRDALDAFAVQSAGRGQYDQAVSTLEEVLLASPNDLDARLALARIYYQIGAHDLAAEHLDQAALVAAGSGFEREIADLRSTIERARRGIGYELAVTAGAAYSHGNLTIAGTPPVADTAEVYTPFVVIDGTVIRMLESASRDELRLGARVEFERALSDTDFDADFDRYDKLGLKGSATYSAGLPDIIDTLRLDVSAYGMLQRYGGGRELQDFGVEAEFTLQPTVESRIDAFAGYGWLGNSTGVFVEHRVRYGVNGEVRMAPGLALGAEITAYQDWGTAPVAFVGGATGYTAHGYKADVSVSHILHVFDDGRSWIHRLGGSYSQERILDHAAIAALIADLADRAAWEVYWDHSVQISTNADFELRVTYGRESITDTIPLLTADREGEFWGVRTGLTYRFN